jgi:TrmH family RNA methyltransferase
LLSECAQGEGVEKLRRLCKEQGVREEIADKALRRISGKDNCFAAVVFEKWQAELESDKPHVVLHHPMDEGNLGTIQRTLLGLGLKDIAVIRPAADAFDPRVVRATMGALFSLRLKQYDSFEAYRQEYPDHRLYPFMLDGSVMLEEAVAQVQRPYALVFGNEGSGLPPEFAQMGQAVRIPHSNEIDSLNLSIAVGIGAYAFVHAKDKQEG